MHHSRGELLSRVLECFQDFLISKKKVFSKNILKSKICSGIQKSHLENCTSILKIPNRKNIFPLITLHIRLYSIPGWRILCVVLLYYQARRMLFYSGRNESSRKEFIIHISLKFPISRLIGIIFHSTPHAERWEH